jgi:hypothetical protein
MMGISGASEQLLAPEGLLDVLRPHDSRRTMVCAEHPYPARPSNSIS